MSRNYEGLWRALLVLDGGDHQVMMQTEPPQSYESVECYLWLIGSAGLPVEGMRVKRALMVPVSA